MIRNQKVAVLFLSLVLCFLIVGIASAEDCQCVICHGPNGPHSGGFPSGCNVCHGNPPLTGQLGADGLVIMPSPTGAATAGAHAKHASSSGYNYSCDNCHFNGMPVTLIAESPAKLQMGFKNMGLGGGSYDGFVLLSPYAYDATNGTTVTTNGSMTCSNIYCHSNGTSVSTGIITPNTSPAWDTAGPLACTACHGYPPAYAQNNPKANSHYFEYHKQQTCNVCHYGTTTDSITIADVTKHNNSAYDVSPNPNATFNGTPVNFNYSYDPGGGGCSSVSCHPGDPGYVWVWGNPRLSATVYYANGTSCYEVNFNRVDITNGTPPYSYSWDFGDGTLGTGLPVTHVYASTGPYYPIVSGRDANNHPFTGTVTGGVYPTGINTPPVANKSISVSRYTVTLTDLSTDSDSSTCGHSGPGSIRINWGGTIQNFPINLTGDPSNQTYQYTFTTAGTKTIQHTITDNSGAQVSSAPQNVVVPSPLYISGTVTHANGTPYSGVTMILKRTNNITLTTTTTDALGNYSFTQTWTDNCYVVQPNRTGSTFTPATLQVGQGCASPTGANFQANN